jgi:uncharacterized protein with HEPN domain/predicted nucleotidyltransferase
MGTAKPAVPRSLSSILDLLIAAIPDLRRRFKAARIGIFGSYARGQEQTGSDLDVLVDFAAGWRYSDLVELKEELDRLLGMKVDVVPKEGLKPFVGKRILADVVWLDETAGSGRAVAIIKERPPSPRPDREIRDFLHNILENIDAVDAFVADGDFDRLLSDRLYRYGFLYALFIIGEATTHIPASTRRNYPDIPWTRIVGLRNVIAHHYPGLTLETIWETARDELEALATAVTRIRAEIDRREGQDRPER